MNSLAKSGHEGVALRAKSGLYRARLKMMGKTHHVGEFVTIEEAVAARTEFYHRMCAVRDAMRAEAAK